jgi:hypothetical protein
MLSIQHDYSSPFKMHHSKQPKANKTAAGNGSDGICRVSNVSRSPSPDPRRYPFKRMKKPEV